MQFRNNKLLGRIKELYGSQEAFGEAIGWSSPKVSKKLSNIANWRLKELVEVATVLHISADEFHNYFCDDGSSIFLSK